jgi:16S rRNA (cytosine967-C5)-methyltransferase
MTPAARLQAAIDVLGRIVAGAPAEQALTNWARGARYAGSGDRAAVRDRVYQALRQRRSAAALGPAPEGAEGSQGQVGRALILGLLRQEGIDPDGLFTGDGHAPEPLVAAERAALAAPRTLTEAQALDCPDWLVAPLRAALGEGFAPVMVAMRQRAALFLRVNEARTNRPAALAALAADGIEAVAHPLAPTALEVRAGEQRLRMSRSYAEGLVEVQDAGSQALVQALPLQAGWRVLDYCAGGGGKTLAIGARARVDLTAHDAAPGRMRDLPARAARAGLRVLLAPPLVPAKAAFDLVLADAPCSGSGTWRRQPEAKWALTPARLSDLTRQQGQILDAASAHVRPGGVLAYATCSLLPEENEAVAQAFAARSGWACIDQRRWGLGAPGGLDIDKAEAFAAADAFFMATFRAPLHHP